jgi:hypothetical protein
VTDLKYISRPAFNNSVTSHANQALVTAYWRVTANDVLIAFIRLLPSAGPIVATSDFYLLFMHTNKPSCNVTKETGFVN